ncbi:hypothetical protein ASPZODRAFT_74312 [Penicilliopsis zonata CBS 506.65]|uniref:Ig-like domain-containing protein n=1 Tax=Penicilliopsis zonata CBS 506.65 TaxID=1073090 RepID=A0A1L9S857_9EURO|nr:hypothetical protein ASPZODRAFT_74312 [Penicilliopsis zonata CBS 506.65]OJJ43344.1 hypothetical protein ASPZODRAFT_74312 [Penicilliopsis zonata CBS 506.65]
MNGTPRLRSAFPQTPQTTQRLKQQYQTPTKARPRPSNELKSPTKAAQNGDTPLVPTQLIDAPSQRLYVVTLYVAINAWKVYESWTASDDLDSTWLFLKWIFIDGGFLFGVQALRIPWIEWSFATTLAVFLIHVAGNVFLMFRIPIPVAAWISGFFKLFWDREISISERHVKPGDIIHNASLILGKQIVHILPEGSAILNPDRIPLCLDAHHTSVELPIRVNQTDPILIELLHIDLDTQKNETISIPSRQLKQMKRQAEKQNGGSRSIQHRDLLLPVKKTGLYRLQRVVDESKLDVHMRTSDSVVVSCPKALIKQSPVHKCKGELSNLILEVEGTPPLKIKYSRQVNQRERGISFQNIQPDGLNSPLLSQKTPAALFNPKQLDISWAQSQKIEVPLNESLNVGGEWIYAIEEVHDGCGNVANYSIYLDESDRVSKALAPLQQFSVHERPRLSLTGCNDRNFLQTARGEYIDLPTNFHPSGQGYSQDGPFTFSYSFNGIENGTPKPRQLSIKDLNQKTQIKEQGWYTLSSVSSQFCSGEILEPSSCYLHNPPEPELAVKYEKIFDKCANNSVGLLVDLDLTGSPPFRLRYTIEHSKGVETKSQVIEGLRNQLDFTPKEAGFYRYRFLDISDAVYGPRSLKDSTPVLEQDVKPPASARFIGSRDVRKACFGEPVSADVSFIGESPWTLQYELIHNGKRTKHTLQSEDAMATITTDQLMSGGEYTLTLTSIQDRSNCKRLLKDSVRIDARSKPPHVAFGHIDKKRDVSALQGSKVEIPLRLSGERPWTVKYKNADTDSHLVEKTFWEANSKLSVDQEGRYELVEVSDASCVGTIDPSANIFKVSWIPLPRILSVDNVAIGENRKISRPDICQGDDDSLELRLSGNPPYTVRYEQQRKAISGSSSVRIQSLRTALGATTVEMDTSDPGIYTYRFTEISDNLYDNDPRNQNPVVVTQRVNALPSAKFDSPGHIYGFCKEDSSGEEYIPITLTGVPPFSLEVSIKHHSNSKSETVSIPNINSNRHNLAIPRRHLDLGQHVVNIQKVRDGRGCQWTTEVDVSSVRISVSDVPTIIPLESKTDYCVGERVSFSLSGTAPFEIFYTFDDAQRKAKSHDTNFRRIAERPGEFTINAVSDGASGKCKAHKNISKIIHPMPSVKISKGQVSVVDIHEGGEAEIHFEFWGTPPFEFTYIRSSNARKGKKAEVLDIKHDISYDHVKTISTSDEGTYEVVAIKDKYCSFSSQQPIGKSNKATTRS